MTALAAGHIVSTVVTKSQHYLANRPMAIEFVGCYLYHRACFDCWRFVTLCGKVFKQKLRIMWGYLK